MLLYLLLPTLVDFTWSRDVPRNSNYTIQHIDSCPDVGYYFRRGSNPNALEPGPCFLCFCQKDSTAICWLRENSRCDVNKYNHNIGRREARIRRSPVGLSDVFFKDAAREVFNRQLPQVCKPYESSFSQGCPPADWCVGCTVCDCDANGHWDCRILSFCDDDKKSKKKTKKQQRTPQGKKLNIQPSKNDTSTLKKNPAKTNKKPPVNAARKLPANTPKKSLANTHRKPVHVAKNRPLNAKRSQANNRPVNKASIATNKRKTAIQKGGASPKPLIIKKDVGNRKSTITKTSSSQKILNGSDTDMITQKVINKVVTAMHKMLKAEVTASLPNIVKMVQKRSMEQMQEKAKQKVKKERKYKSPTSHKKAYNKAILVKKSPENNVKNGKRPIENKKIKLKNNQQNKQNNQNKRKKRDVSEDSKETTASLNVTKNELLENTQGKIQTTTVYLNTNESLLKTYFKYNNTIITTSPKSILSNDNYYKYSIESTVNNITTSTINNWADHNFTITEMPYYNNLSNRIESSSVGKSSQGLMESGPFANDLKFNSWSEVKYYKEKEKQFLNENNTDMYKKIYFTDNYNSSNINTKPKPIVHTKDVERKVGNYRKHNLTKIVNVLRYKENTNQIDNDTNFKKQISYKIESLQSLLKKLLNEFRMNYTTEATPKLRKVNVVKYLRKFFRHMFSKVKNRTRIYNNKEHRHTIQTLCETFGPCVLNKRNNVLLKRKLIQLNNETKSIMKSIKIIKGLLRLLNFPTIEISTANMSKEEYHFKTDVQKLKIILKKSFHNDEYANKLTDTQISQINYIKNNTHVFIQSVGRFVNVLNEVVRLLTVRKKVIYSQQKRHSEPVILNTNIWNSTKEKPMSRLKKLLQKYNLIHNTFIRKMHDMLTGNESNRKPFIINVGMKNRTDNAEAIERFSKNIIKNLRKLKNLANSLNVGNRKKRHTMRDDDAVEYLLMLMEYLLKQNYPLDAAPANDGIDLLIEAIKNAPDIKPIKKKVLEYTPIKRTKFRSQSIKVPPEESLYDSQKLFIENNSSFADDSRYAIGEQSIDDDKLYDKNISGSKSERDSATEASLPDKYDSESATANNKTSGVQTEYPSEVYIRRNNEDVDNNILEKARANSSGDKKFELFNDDFDDDNDDDSGEISTTTKSSVQTVMSSTNTEDTTTDMNLSEIKMRYFNSDATVNNTQTKTGLEWVDINEDEVNPKLLNTSSTKPVTVKVTTKAPPRRVIQDVSSITKEIDEENKKNTLKINPAEVMYKKQMDLLNSLDYGTEGSVLEDSDSKDNVYDRLYSNNDAYFI